MALKADDDHSRPLTPAEQPTQASAPSGASRSRSRRGPKTAAGKKKVSENALTHGLSSARLIVLGEDSADWETYRRRIVEDRAPVAALEALLAERGAASVWRLRRVTAYEEQAFAEQQERPNITRLASLMPQDPATIERIMRYEAHLTRQLYQAQHELEAMQAARRGRPTPL